MALRAFVRAIIIISLGSLAACSTTRYLQPGESLVTKVQVKGLKDADLAEQLNGFASQKPNHRFFGVFKFNLWVYDVCASGKSRKWKTKLQQNIGEPAVVYDSTLSALSANQMSQFLFSKGYFTNKVDFSVQKYKKGKKCRLKYVVDADTPYTVRSIAIELSDSNLARVYAEADAASVLKPGEQYDEENLQAEQERLYQSFRNQGYYRFVRQYIHYDVDSSLNSRQVDLMLQIKNPEDGTLHQAYTINDVSIAIQSDRISDDFRRPDTMNTSRFYYIDPLRKFNPIIFNKTVFLQKNELFRQSDVDLTYNRLGDMGVFRFSNIAFQEDSIPNRLNAKVSLVPSKRFSIRPEIEGTVNSGNLGGNGSLGYSDRNVFRGAELFELGIKGGVETQRAIGSDLSTPLLARKQLAISSNLYFPKLLLPFVRANYNIGSPRSFISATYTFDERSSYYFRRIANLSFGYDWKDTRTKSHYVKLMDVNVVSSYLTPSLTQKLLDQGNFYLLRSFIPYFSLGTQYRYTDNRQNPQSPLSDYFFFRFTVDLAGNTLSAMKDLLELPRDTAGSYRIFGLVYYQYVRPEIDLRFYNVVNDRSKWVFRINPGIGLAYGNSKVLPFEKQFFAGGSTSLRAWRARRIGPGSFTQVTNRASEVEQTGDVKLEGNIEYRFQIIRRLFGARLNGATFLDAGNVWMLKEDLSLPGSQLKGSTLWKTTAVGSGAGIRLDYGFFIFRFDIGLKLKDPSYAQGGGWVIERFSDDSFKKANNYQFLNYTFGIGYPF